MNLPNFFARCLMLRPLSRNLRACLLYRSRTQEEFAERCGMSEGKRPVALGLSHHPVGFCICAYTFMPVVI